MKTNKAITLTIALLMLSVILISNLGYVFAAKPTKTNSCQFFTLEASGTAYDSSILDYVDVELDLEGCIRGHSSMVHNLDVTGITVTVEGYKQFTVIKGSGVLVTPSKYVHLNIMIDKEYGGRQTVWVLSGEITDDLSYDPMPISLGADRIVLPTADGRILTDLSLKGTVEFSE